MSTNSSNDRASLCAFTFADGRQCRMPRRVGHPYLCAFHARKEAQALDGETAGRDIAYHLSGNYLSACDLTSALGRLFSAVAQGQLKPKTASTLAYLGQTLAQTLHLAQGEYINAYGTDFWRETIRTSLETVSRPHVARHPISNYGPRTRFSRRSQKPTEPVYRRRLGLDSSHH